MKSSQGTVQTWGAVWVRAGRGCVHVACTLCAHTPRHLHEHLEMLMSAHHCVSVHTSIKKKRDCLTT